MKKKLTTIIPVAIIGIIVIFGLISYFGIRLYAKSVMLPKELAESGPEEAAKLCEQKSGLSRDQCYFQVALLAFNDPLYSDGRYCLMISNLQQKEPCILTYAAFWNNSQLCSELQIPEIRATCFASVSRDELLCDEISSEYGRSMCISQVRKLIPRDHEKNICLEIPDSGEKDDCFYYLAYKYKDHSICKSIENEPLMLNCIAANLYYHYQANACSELQGKDKDMCFTYSAGIEKDKSICDNIENITWKTICMNG